MPKFLSYILLLFTVASYGAIYPMPQNGDDIVGTPATIVQIQPNDNVDKLMQKYEISYHELLEANPLVKFSRLKAGSSVLIPSQLILPEYRKGLVINIAELRVYYFLPDGQHVFTTTVGLGRSEWRTPTMVTSIIKKEQDPVWHVPKAIAQYTYETRGKILPAEVLPGPENPLGKYALYLKKNGYLIHGTNDPTSVGKYYSSGCMRLSSDAIEFLYHNVPIGTPVYIIHHAVKSGWLNNELYLESHVPVEYNELQDGDLDNKNIMSAIQLANQHRHANIDWQKVKDVSLEHLGLPEPIGSEVAYAGSDENQVDLAQSNATKHNPVRKNQEEQYSFSTM